jgi:hypothetical protein
MLSWSRQEIESVAQSIHEATRAIDNSLAAILDDVQRLGERGWTVPVRQLPDFATILVRSVPPEHTDAVFVRLYSEKGGGEFDALGTELLRNPELQRWNPLIEQCLGAYLREEHLLVVPSLLTAYEGALASVVDQPHEMRPKDLAKRELSEAEANIERVPWVSIEAFTRVIFQSAEFAAQRPNLLNRHWVLHGRDAPSWSQADSLRLFQALHTLGSARLSKREDRLEWIRDPVLKEYFREHDQR